MSSPGLPASTEVGFAFAGADGRGRVLWPAAVGATVGAAVGPGAAVRGRLLATSEAASWRPGRFGAMVPGFGTGRLPASTEAGGFPEGGVGFGTGVGVREGAEAPALASTWSQKPGLLHSLM